MQYITIKHQNTSKPAPVTLQPLELYIIGVTHPDHSDWIEYLAVFPNRVKFNFWYMPKANEHLTLDEINEQSFRYAEDVFLSGEYQEVMISTRRPYMLSQLVNLNYAGGFNE